MKTLPHPQQATPPTLGLHEAAAMMRVHPQTVLDKIGAGELPAARVGRAYVLMTKDVMAHIEHEIIQQTAARMRGPMSKRVRQRVSGAH